MIGPETRAALLALNERLTHPPLNTNPGNPSPSIPFEDEDRLVAAFIEAVGAELESLREQIGEDR